MGSRLDGVAKSRAVINKRESKREGEHISEKENVAKQRDSDLLGKLCLFFIFIQIMVCASSEGICSCLMTFDDQPYGY